MSQENIEVLRAFFAAWNAGDMDALRELHDPDVIMRAPKGWPEPGPEVGRDAVMRQFEQLRETWDTDSVEPISDFIDVGDRVLVRFISRTAARALDHTWSSRTSPRFGMAKSFARNTTGITRRPSKPPACQSRTLTPTPSESPRSRRCRLARVAVAHRASPSPSAALLAVPVVLVLAVVIVVNNHLELPVGNVV